MIMVLFFVVMGCYSIYGADILINTGEWRVLRMIDHDTVALLQSPTNNNNISGSEINFYSLSQRKKIDTVCVDAYRLNTFYTTNDGTIVCGTYASSSSKITGLLRWQRSTKKILPSLWLNSYIEATALTPLNDQLLCSDKAHSRSLLYDIHSNTLEASGTVPFAFDALKFSLAYDPANIAIESSGAFVYLYAFWKRQQIKKFAAKNYVVLPDTNADGTCVAASSDISLGNLGNTFITLENAYQDSDIVAVLNNGYNDGISNNAALTFLGFDLERANLLYSADYTNIIKQWDIVTQQCINRFHLPEGVFVGSITVASRMLWVDGSDGNTHGIST